jgi:hypothetical protein
MEAHLLFQFVVEAVLVPGDSSSTLEGGIE